MFTFVFLENDLPPTTWDGLSSDAELYGHTYGNLWAAQLDHEDQTDDDKESKNTFLPKEFSDDFKNGLGKQFELGGTIDSVGTNPGGVGTSSNSIPQNGPYKLSNDNLERIKDGTFDGDVYRFEPNVPTIGNIPKEYQHPVEFLTKKAIYRNETPKDPGSWGGI